MDYRIRMIILMVRMMANGAHHPRPQHQNIKVLGKYFLVTKKNKYHTAWMGLVGRQLLYCPLIESETVSPKNT